MANYAFIDTQRHGQMLKRLADNTFAMGLPSLQHVMQYLDAVAYQLWDVKH
jgi:hypothetical protein